jgi:hypothetical protein
MKSRIEEIRSNGEVPAAATAAKSGSDDDILNRILDAVNEAIRLSEEGGSGVNEKVVLGILAKYKVTKTNLAPDVISFIESKRQLEIMPLKGITVELKGTVPPLFFKAMSDLQSNNNVYLYGSAGTGKTFIAQMIADALNCTLVTINCNQYTSPLEIIGGQTIEGYQEGKLITAWGNLTRSEEGGVKQGMEVSDSGCLLLLDELPKIDPNTAGLLNDALAKLKSSGKNSRIQNSRGEFFEKKRFYCIATGNSKLNEDSTSYVANFKQDLSLQDRFIGSTYEVFVPVNVEYTIMSEPKSYLFIFNYMNSIRALINSVEGKNMNIDSKAFVSIRILQSLKDTWRYWHDNHKTIDGVKTLKDSMNSFFDLFTPEQVTFLKGKSDYESFSRLITTMQGREDGADLPTEIAQAKATLHTWNELNK